MIIAKSTDANRKRSLVVLLFGTGLLGMAILRSLAARAILASQEWPWRWHGDSASDEATVEKAARNALDTPELAGLAVVWAAGRSGFVSDEAAMEHEYRALLRVVRLAQRLAGAVDIDIDRAFHLVSSAGGLFEGQQACTRDAVPRPLRPYGHGKLAQELLLAQAEGLGRRRVYRPSSVYGFEPGGRMNLVTALVQSALTRKPVRITGSLGTQRDFILASDVGRFIADSILETCDTPHLNHLLVSSRPSSVFELIKLTEARFDTRLILEIDPAPANSRDITFLQSALPNNFHPTHLWEGISRIASLFHKGTI